VGDKEGIACRPRLRERAKGVSKRGKGEKAKGRKQNLNYYFKLSPFSLSPFARKK
jgi:hypothetical protein